MTQDAKNVMDEFLDTCKRAGSTVYNQGIVDGLVNLKNLIKENENITLEELKATIDLFIKNSTVGESGYKGKKTEEAPSTKIVSDNENTVDDIDNPDAKIEDGMEHIDLSKPIPITGFTPNLQEMLNNKIEELSPATAVPDDPMGLLASAFMNNGFNNMDNIIDTVGNEVNGEKEEEKDTEDNEAVKEAECN